MRPAIHDILSTNVDNVAANGASRVEGQCLVLLDGEHVQLALVDGSLIHSAGNGGVDQLAGEEGYIVHSTLYGFQCRQWELRG